MFNDGETESRAKQMAFDGDEGCWRQIKSSILSLSVVLRRRGKGASDAFAERSWGVPCLLIYAAGHLDVLTLQCTNAGA